MSKPTYRASAPVHKNGKTRWINIGSAWDMFTEKGFPFISLKLDSLPTSSDWDGQVTLFPLNEEADDTID